MRALADLPLWADIALLGILLFAGVVKGVIGVGLPLLIVPLATQVLPPTGAIALLSVPMVLTNIGQGTEGGATWVAVRSLTTLLIPLIIGCVIGVHFLISVDRHSLNLSLGVIFLALAGLLLAAPRLRIGPQTARWAAPAVGLLSGLLGGVSAMFGPPMLAFQIGRGVTPDQFIKQMAILAFVASVTLMLALGGSGALSLPDLLISALAMIPIQAGMPLGRALRGRIPPAVFRTVILVVLGLSGLDLLRRSLF